MQYFPYAGQNTHLVSHVHVETQQALAAAYHPILFALSIPFVLFHLF